MTVASNHDLWATPSAGTTVREDAQRTGLIRATRSVQLAVGIACAIIGAEALVVPSRFMQVLLPFGGLDAGVPLLGIAFVALGACLCAVGVLEVRRRMVVAACLSAGLLLCLIGALRFAAQAWLDGTLYGCAGMFVAISAFLPVARTRARPGPVVTVARTLIGLTLVGLGLATSAGRHDWATTALYVGLGTSVAFGAWLSPRQPPQFSSVRVRLAIMTVVLTSGSLILASLAIATSAEKTALADTLADQRLTAGEVTQHLAQADSDYRGLVTTLAARAGLAQLDSNQQRALLQGLTATNVYAFSTYDGAGQPLARSDDRAPAPLPPQMLADLTQSRAAVAGLSTVPGTDQPALIFAAPYSSSGGALAGYAAAELDVAQLNQALGSIASVGRAGTSVFVLGPDGDVLLHPLPTRVEAATDPPRVETGNATPESGTLRYRLNGLEYAAACGTVSSLGWHVVSTYPVSYAVGGVQTGREWAFGLLLLTGGLSTLLGLVLAERVVGPLNVLGNAMDDLAAEVSGAPLPHSSLAEVQRLTNLFVAMRNRLMVRTEEREHALDAAREAIRVREEFMSIAAHELKTPVTATRGHAQLLLRRMRTGDQLDPTRMRDSLERINSQTKKLARLIEQLLDIARLERGTFTIELQQSDLRDLVGEVVADWPERDRITVRVPDAALIVNADAGRLEQVLSNLLDNAMKFGPPDGRVDVELSRPTSGTVRLMVRDGGLGIPPEHREHIFERFHQAHAESHRSGFGLGLYIAKEIVDRHAGTIGIDCPGSGGTRVWVDLPLAGAVGASGRQAA